MLYTFKKSGPERLEVKREITRALDIIAAQHRCLFVHPINPPHLIHAVEISPTPWPDPEIVKLADDMMRACQRVAIVLSKEIDGFVIDRLQGALLEEAHKPVGSDIASAEDLDKSICDGLAVR